MQPLFSLGRIVESPKVESADSQIRENYGHALAHKNSGACPGQMRFVSAKKVHRTRHEAVAETSATSPIDENSKVLGQDRPVHDGVHRVFKFAERVRIGEHQFCSTTHVTGMRHLYVRMPRERRSARRPQLTQAARIGGVPAWSRLPSFVRPTTSSTNRSLAMTAGESTKGYASQSPRPRFRLFSM